MEELHHLNIDEIRPNPYQPRMHFDPEQLAELAQSIQQNGVIQPIIVRQSSILGYELLAGERRLRASKLAGLHTIPAVIKDLSDDDLLYQAIIENLQRADLSPIEEASSYQALIQKGLTHDEIAQIMGKSRPYISNSLRLLSLSPESQKELEKGTISQGHARLLIGLTEGKQARWIEEISKQELSVRALERLLANKKKTDLKKRTDPFLREEEQHLSRLLGSPVTIQQKRNGSGTITIDCHSLEELERIINNLKESCE